MFMRTYIASYLCMLELQSVDNQCRLAKLKQASYYAAIYISVLANTYVPDALVDLETQINTIINCRSRNNFFVNNGFIFSQ